MASFRGPRSGAGNRLNLSLEELDSDQYEAATAPRGPLAIVAGAGTGKTRTITHRIAYLINQGFVTPQQVHAVTFTTKAAEEMRERLRIMGAGAVQARTFHAAARKQLSYFWPRIAGDLPWRILDDKFRMVSRALRHTGIKAGKDTIRDVIGEIEWSKARLISAADYEKRVEQLHREPPIAAEKVADAYRVYEDIKATPDGVFLDFDDLLLYVAGAMENLPEVAEEFRARYRSFVVDEFQDVTPLQQRVLDGWLGDRDDITVVGDANQTIYSFTGADPSFLLRFPRRFENATVVRLQRDYRSTPQVVGLANKVISQSRDEVSTADFTLEGQRPAGPEPVFEEFDDESLEAAVVARRVRRLIDSGVPPSEIAILFRLNAQSEKFEHALDEANIPHHVRGGKSFFDRAEITGSLAALERLASAHMESGTIHTGDELISDIKAVLARQGLSTRAPAGERARERWESLSSLYHLIVDIVHASPGADMPAVMSILRERAQSNRPPAGVEGVTLATIHAAKGLEWDAVFVVGLVEGTLPIRQAIALGSSAIEEERRLLYVAVTRAREHLQLSWSLARESGGRASRKRTRFLDGIAPTSKSSADHSPKGKRSSRLCSECGATLQTPAEKVMGHCANCGGDVDAELVDALQRWRSRRAHQQGTPSYTVFSNATMMAIAERQPSTAEELLDISGIGPAKLELYGDDILRIVAESA